MVPEDDTKPVKKFSTMSATKNQSTIALSSAEAELYGIIKTASETLGIASILWDWKIKLDADLMADASAALGIIGRTGLGKMRHVDTSYLWLQQQSIKDKIKFNKVPGTENPADMNTKGLNENLINKYVEMMNMEHREGRSDLAPELHSITKKEKCQRFNSTENRITKRPTNKYSSNNSNVCSNECQCNGIYVYVL